MSVKSCRHLNVMVCLAALLLGFAASASGQRRPVPRNDTKPASRDDDAEGRITRLRSLISSGDQQATTVRYLGLKVMDIDAKEVFGERANGVVVVVTSIQRGGSAYFMGIGPGDMLRSSGKFTNTRMLADYINSRYHEINNIVAVATIRTGNWLFEENEIELPLLEVQGTEWITELPPVRRGVWATEWPGLSEARLELGRRTKEISSELVSLAKTKPCKEYSLLSDEVDPDLSLILRKLIAWRLWGNLNERTVGIRDLKEIMKTACENKDNGEPSQFETAVWAIIHRRLEPCDYVPTADYRSVFYNDRILYPKFTKRAYNYWYESDLVTLRLPPNQETCFVNLLKSNLTSANPASSR